MIRNREILLQLVLAVLISAIGLGGIHFFPGHAFSIAFAMAVALIIASILFTLWRYKRIESLSQLLKRIAIGEYELDVRDSKEGELNILKSEIYKVTVTLREQASNLMKEKDFLVQSLSDISHQLKTPLTSMSVMTELLQSESLPAEKRLEFTRSILVQIQRLEWLVSSLLRMAQLDAGSLQFKATDVEMRAIVEHALRHLLIPIEVKDLVLEVDIPDEVTIHCDPNWTAEALTNVIKNAVEHTPEGGKIQIRGEQNIMYELIEVRDSGAGISRTDLPHIFERFYKANSAAKESIGIGLAMSKSLLQRQSASITVRSEEGRGSIFTIKFYKQIV